MLVLPENSIQCKSPSNKKGGECDSNSTVVAVADDEAESKQVAEVKLILEHSSENSGSDKSTNKYDAQIHLESKCSSSNSDSNVNGSTEKQSKTAPPGFSSTPNPTSSHQNGTSKGNENVKLYVGNLHRIINTANLRESFSAFGTILDCGIWKDLAGYSIGSGWVEYESSSSAYRAIEKLNGMVIYDKTITVTLWTEENIKNIVREKLSPGMEPRHWLPSETQAYFKSVFIKNFPNMWQENDLCELINRYALVPPVSFDVTIARSHDNVTKGYAFANFDDHISAQKAVRHLNGMRINQHTLYVSRCISKSERITSPALASSYNLRSSGTNLYVKNFPMHWRNEELAIPFHEFGQVTGVKVMVSPSGKSKGFGFVSLATSESAEMAMIALHDKYTFPNGKRLYVRHHERKEERMKRLEQEFRSKGYYTGDRGWKSRSRAKPMQTTSGEYISPTIPTTARGCNVLSSTLPSTALYNSHLDTQNHFLSSEAFSMEDRLAAFPHLGLVKKGIVDKSIAEDNKAEEHLKSVAIGSRGQGSVARNQQLSMTTGSRAAHPKERDDVRKKIPTLPKPAQDKNAATRNTHATQVQLLNTHSPEQHLPTTVSKIQKTPQRTVGDPAQRVSNAQRQHSVTNKLRTPPTSSTNLPKVSLYPHRASAAEEQSTNTRSSDRRSYAHIVRSISRAKNTPEQFNATQVQMTSPCNPSDQRGSVVVSGDNSSNITKAFPRAQEEKAESSMSNSIHAARCGIPVKRSDNYKGSTQGPPAWRKRSPDIQKQKLLVAAQKGHRTNGAKRLRNNPAQVNGTKNVRGAIIPSHGITRRNTGSTYNQSDKQSPRTSSERNYQGHPPQSRTKVTTRQLPSTCLRLDNWKLAGGPKKVEEFLSAKIGGPLMNVQKWPSTELNTSWFCVFHTKNQAALAMNKVDGYQLPSGAVLKLIALQPKKS